MTNAICESKNKSWVTIDYCRLRAVNRNKTTLTVSLNVLHPAYDIIVRVEVKKRANGYKTWLGSNTVDGCAFMRRVNHPYFKMLYSIIKDYSTINHTCPYVGKNGIKDFFWDARNFSLPMPSGEYLMLGSWKFNKRTQFITNIYFTFYQDLLKE
ncbi:uncharacterized protein LOC122322623 [Drosophila grimshawi]|nr:uncharacterized protein LOC122322623 [Drosophila grimshawi]